HTTRKGKRYRYYITHTAQKEGHDACAIRMLRAGDIEGIVFDQLKILFKQPQVIVQTWKATQAQDKTITENDVRKGLQSIETLWDHLFHNEQARLLHLFIQRIDVAIDGVAVTIRTNGVNDLVRSIKKIHSSKKAEAYAH
ncbi:MAG: site-specific DNA recombinase, partial [Gammaproteobacteria bacterium]